MLKTLHSHIFKLYSVVFSYPDKRLSNWIAHGDLDELFEIFLTSGDQAVIRYHQWRRGSDHLLDSLQSEYTRLFINAVPHLLAPPYASYYREKTLFGSTTEMVLHLYERYNFQLSSNTVEMPDHIAIMLEFLYHLTEDSVPWKEIKIIVKQHYKWWVPQWVARIKAHASLPFYEVSGSGLVNFLENEF